MDNKYFSKTFVIITVFFVVCLLISNICAGKIIAINNLIMDAGNVLFPISYIFGDVLTEVYGFKKSRLVIWLGFACNLFMVIIFSIVIALPYPNFWNSQDAYATVLGMTPRIVMASLIAYFVGEFLNSTVLSKMKVVTKGKSLWMRTIGSTIVGELADTLIFVTLAFYGTMPQGELLKMFIAQYIFKVTYEIIFTPVTYKVIKLVKKLENIDTYDNGIKYNPFNLEI